MAGNSETNPDAEAKKWFTIAIVGAFLYVSTVFAFVVTREVEKDHSATEGQHWQSH
jgi:hypothetical protein